jgi:gluconolactonase
VRPSGNQWPSSAARFVTTDMLEVEVFCSGFDHAEDIAFASDGALWAGGELGQIYRLDLGASEPTELLRLGGETRGIAFDADGSAIVCNHLLSAVYRVWPDGRCESLDAVASGRPIRVPNYAVFGPDGSLYVSDSWRFPEPDGFIYVWRPAGGPPTIFHSGPFAYPNGLAIDSHGDWLYVVESATNAISRVPLEGPGGRIERVASGVGEMPDGIAFDADGFLWAASFADDAIYRVDANGRVELMARDSRALVLNRPANVAFGGRHFDQLFVANLGSNYVSVIDVGVRGQYLWGGLNGVGRA